MRISDWSSDVCSSDLLEVQDATGRQLPGWWAVGSTGDQRVWATGAGRIHLHVLRHSDGAGITAGVVADGFRPHPGSLGRMMATADKRAATHSRSCNDYATHLADRKSTRLNSSH